MFLSASRIDDTPVFFNITHIGVVSPRADGGCFVTMGSDPENIYTIKESFEEVKKAIVTFYLMDKRLK